MDSECQGHAQSGQGLHSPLTGTLDIAEYHDHKGN